MSKVIVIKDLMMSKEKRRTQTKPGRCCKRPLHLISIHISEYVATVDISTVEIYITSPGTTDDKTVSKTSLKFMTLKYGLTLVEKFKLDRKVDVCISCGLP